MPFDPDLPVNNSPISSSELRAQFNGLKEELQLICVTQGQYSVDYEDTARNPLTVARLEMAVSDPPTQAEVQAIADKIDELIDALKRP